MIGRVQTDHGGLKDLLGLLRRYAYAKKTVTLASGQTSDVYLDCRKVSFRGDGACLIGALLFEHMEQIEKERGYRFEGCAGMAIGAVPIAMALSMTAQLNHRQLPALCVRAQPKSHGTQSLVEGALSPQGAPRVLLVEDVVTTGGSTLKAAHALRQEGYQLSDAIALVDRGHEGRGLLLNEGITLHNFFDLSDFGATHA